MINPPLPDVKLKNSALNITVENTLIKTISDKIRLIPGYEQLKNDIEITEHICNLVENTITGNNNSKPIDKKALVIKIVSQLFNINGDAEKVVISQQIDYLINNNMIQKIPLATKILNSLKNWALKQIS